MIRRLLLGAMVAVAIALAAQAATAQSAFVVSFAANSRIGGTEMRVLAAHDGRLFAGNGYWEDREGQGRQGAQSVGGVFFAGYDANGTPAHDAACIVHVDLATALAGTGR